MLCPISCAMPHPKYDPETFSPSPSTTTGEPLPSPGTESHSMPMWLPAAYMNAPANMRV